jgi:hypothetical protein
MPSARRWSVPQGRILVSVVLAIIGAFLVCGSVGMQTWLVGGIGAAIIAVGAGLFVISAINSRATSEVEGIAHVSDRTSPPANVKFGRCRLHLIVNARGIENVSVRIRDGAVPVAKWPDRGATLPVMIPIDNPQKTRVLWNEVPTHGQVAAERARVRAAEADIMDEDFVRGADLDDLDFASSSVRPRAGSPTEVVEAEWADEDRDVDDSVLVDAGVRVIELDVMDPSVMRWSSTPPPSASGSAGASAAAASGPAASAASGTAASVATPSTRPPGSRPSPRPRGPRRPGTMYGTPASAATADVGTEGGASSAPAATEPAPVAGPSRSADPPPSEPPPSEEAPSTAEPAGTAGPAGTATDDVAPAQAGPTDVAPVADDLASDASDTASGADDAARTEQAPAGAPFEDSSIGRSTGAESGDDSAEHATPTVPDGDGVTPLSGPPEWPPRRPSAAGRSYSWDQDDDRVADDEPLGGAHPSNEGVAPLPRRRPAIEIAVNGDGDDGEPKGGQGDVPADGPHVPHHRPVPPDEVFDQDASPDE